MRLKMEFDTKEFDNKLNARLSAIGFAKRQILVEDAEAIMKRSLELVPVKSGALISTEFIEVTKDRLSGAEVTFGYSGEGINPDTDIPVADYIIQVHEDLDMNHPNGGQAKFLEQAVDEYTAKFKPSLTKKLAKLFKR